MHTSFYWAVLGWLSAWFLLWRLPRLDDAGSSARDVAAPPMGEGASVTIVIPARNEEQNLQRLLGDLEAARPPGAHVIVVDDHSTDRTAAVAASFPFVQVRPAPELPPNWVGKSWACHCGAKEAAPGVLVFLDADVRIPGDGLRKALEAQRIMGGLLSVQPYHQVERPYEQLSAPFNVMAVMSVGVAQAVAPRRPSGVFGPVLVTATEDYVRVGGHEAVAAQPVDDFALARSYARAGLPTKVYGGHRDLAFRMYPHGVRSLLEGWTKNFAFGALAAPLWRTALVGLWWYTSLRGLRWHHGLFQLQGAVLYPLFAAQMYVLYRRVGSFHPLTAVLYPIPHVLFGFVFASSIVKTLLLRRVPWKGRTLRYRVGGPKP